MALLEFDPTAEAELDALYDSDEEGAALIDALLEVLEETPELLDCLCIEDRNVKHTPSFQVKRFQTLWNNRYTIYILKIWHTDGRLVQHRVIYAHHPQKDAYYILAVMSRDLNYEADKELIARICDSYEDYGIPRY